MEEQQTNSPSYQSDPEPKKRPIKAILLSFLALVFVAGIAFSAYGYTKSILYENKQLKADLAQAKLEKEDNLPDSNSEKTTEITLTLLDKASQSPLKLIKVNLYNDDSIRCIQAPCPTNTKSWTVTTDQYGKVSVATKDIQNEVTITPENYQPKKLEQEKNAQSYMVEFIKQP